MGLCFFPSLTPQCQVSEGQLLPVPSLCGLPEAFCSGAEPALPQARGWSHPPDTTRLGANAAPSCTLLQNPKSLRPFVVVTSPSGLLG